MIFIMAFVGGIISGRPHLIRSLGLGITGPPYSLMFEEKSELASNAKSSLESNNSNLCH
jgi:hypothetical protein